MADTTNQSDQILGAAGQSLASNRNGGIHRSAASIGSGSAGIKSKHFTKKLLQIVIGVVGVMVAAGLAGAILNGIGFWGIMMSVLAIAVVIGVVSTRKVKVPKRAELTKGDPKQMVARTELWLEAQRPALPPPAVQVVDQLGVQLDALGLQLETLDQAHPSVNEVRELVGEYIPETIDDYRKIPAHLRQESHAGKSADDRLTESLTKISNEVDRVTRRMAEGALDDLAIKSRYLDYRFGGSEALEDKS